MFILRYRDPLRYGKHLDRCDWRGHVEEKALILGDALDQVRLDAEREAAGLPREVVRDIPFANDDEDDRDEDEVRDDGLEDDLDEDEEAVLPPDVPSTSSTSAPLRNRHARRRAVAKRRKR